MFWLACQRRVPTVSCNYGFWTFYFAKNFTVYFSWMEWKKLNSVSSAHMTASLTVKTFNIFLGEVTFFLQRGGSLIICFFWYRFSSTFCLMKNNFVLLDFQILALQTFICPGDLSSKFPLFVVWTMQKKQSGSLAIFWRWFMRKKHELCENLLSLLLHSILSNIFGSDICP